jgi:hypothetical protein
MSLMGDAENLLGQGGEDNVVGGLAKDVEQDADNATGGKFDSEIQDAGNSLEQDAEQDLPKL